MKNLDKNNANFLHTMAEKDTPDTVAVPNTWLGILVWALGRWGAGVIFAFAAWFLYQDFRTESNRVYADNKISGVELLVAYREQTKINEQVAAALTKLSDAVNQIRINQVNVDDNTRRILTLEKQASQK